MTKNKNLRVLVVDDTIVYRKAVSDVIEEIQGVELAGVAHNGKIALAKMKYLKPDLLTLDIEMPVMNGLELLAILEKEYPDVGVIVLSTLTTEGSDMTMRALELGAFDFILKPQSKSQAEGKLEIRRLLQPMLRAFSQSRLKASPPRTAQKTAATTLARKNKSEIVTIGISTGGPNALSKMLPMLPANLGVPVLIVQHMPPVFTKSLAKNLDKKCALNVKEAVEGEILHPNIVYIAPGGYQMKIVANADGLSRRIKLTNDPPENSCKPSVDYLFRSIADYYVGRTTAVIMTGMGSDGAKGLEILQAKGAYIIGQDEPSCVVYGMPKTPAELGYLDVVEPLDKIAAAITQSVGQTYTPKGD